MPISCMALGKMKIPVLLISAIVVVVVALLMMMMMINGLNCSCYQNSLYRDEEGGLSPM